jgi:hypothetical protein
LKIVVGRWKVVEELKNWKVVGELKDWKVKDWKIIIGRKLSTPVLPLDSCPYLLLRPSGSGS